MVFIRLVAGIFLVTIVSSNILRFRPASDIQDLYHFLMKPSLPARYRDTEYYSKFGLVTDSKQLQSFSYTNCGNNATELALLTALTVSPDPVSLPGTVTIGFALDIRQTVNSPLQVDVVLEKSVFGSFIKFPCLDNFGSCNYPDFCTILSGVSCPPEFTDRGIPCSCPFTAGKYSLPSISFTVDVPFLPSGDYRATANMTYNGQSVGCYQITATFS